MVKPKIACYITGGWTECGIMTRFLEKMNDQYDYRQRFPQKNIGKKGKPRKTHEIDGTTGRNLIKWAYNDMRKHKDDLLDCCAILIEDDMDNEYLSKEECVRDYKKIEERKREITVEIREILGKREMPIFFLYALPEIESWFVADWDNTFGIEYKNKLKHMNSYFSVTFRSYILKYILTEKYPLPEIENYGYFGDEYKKLSDELIQGFYEYSCQVDAYKNNSDFNEKINQLIKENQIMYSKKAEGKNMLLRLSPENVAKTCGHYFARTYNDLKTFQAGI